MVMDAAGPAVVALRSASKRYRPPSGRWRGRHEHWALRDVDLALRPGETLGVLGHNGAGKTTLLRLLGGVTQPTTGAVHVEGRIAPLISVGVGFHNELSGRENVCLNGLLLGLTREQVLARYDSIVEFSELDDVLDSPVKFYSSGMLMRLAFSVAMHVDADVLLVDEVLAVGDLAFQLKCLERMRELQRGGATLVMVSHSLHAVRLLCTRVIVLDHGRLVYDGAPDLAVVTYLDLLGAAAADDPLVHAGRGAVLTARQLVDADGAPAGELEFGKRYHLRYQLRFEVAAIQPVLTVTAVGETGSVAHELSAPIGPPTGFEAGATVPVEISFTAHMGGGTYRLSVRLTTADGATLLCEDLDRTVVYRAPIPGSYGVAELGASIELGGHDLTDHAPVQIGGGGR